MAMWLRARGLAAAVGTVSCVAGGVVGGVPAPAAVAAGGAGVPSAAPVSAPAGGAVFDALGPLRVLDTRNGTGAPTGKIGAGQSVSLTVTGVDGVPASGVSAVVLNVTATDATSASYVTVYPDGGSRPLASNLNFTAGETIPNLVVVPVGADGKVDFYNHAGSVDLLADLSGYYTASGSGSLFDSMGPARVLDTRDGTGTGGTVAPVGPGQSISLTVTGANGVPASGVSAVALNVTAVDATTASYVTVYPDGGSRPLASNLNFTSGEVFPNLVIVPVGPDGKVDFYNHTGSVDLVADLAGYYTASGEGSVFDSLGPARVLDTRNGTGGTSTPVGAGQSISLKVTGVGGVPASGVTAVALNVTAVDATSASYVTVYPDGGPRPLASNLNFTNGEVFPNLVIVPVGPDGKVDFYNHSGSVDLVADLAGYDVLPWESTQAPLPADASGTSGGVEAVACPPSGSACVAVGDYEDSAANQQAMLLTGSGPSWTAVKAPLPGNAAADPKAYLDAVACGSSTACVAVGTYVDSSGSREGLLVSSDGSSWTAQEAPMPTGAGSNPFAGLFAVACGSTSECVAVGTYSTATAGLGLVETGYGTSWTAIDAPLPANADPSNPGAWLDTVACPSAAGCEVAGHYNTGSNIQGVLLSGLGSTWTATQAPLPAGALASDQQSVRVPSITCASATSCVAVGHYFTSGDNTAPLVLTGSGSSWTAIKAPLPANASAGGASLAAVACPSPTACTAGGGYTDTSGSSLGLLLSGSGSSWTATETPLPTGAATAGGTQSAGISDLACPSVGSCVAVGLYSSPVTGSGRMLLTGSGASWTAMTLPLMDGGSPFTGFGPTVGPVACLSSISCTAVNTYTDSGGHVEGLLSFGPA